MDSIATEQDFLDMMDSLSKRSDDRKFVAITGVGGYLGFVFRVFGRQKLPRKLKKEIYLTKKLRQQHIPEYYARPVDKTYRI